jgi:hypothetical protein
MRVLPAVIVGAVALTANHASHASLAVEQADPSVKTQVHKKEAGGGYLPGSPKYEEQQAALGRFTEATMPEVSTTVKCIIYLTTTYFVLHTLNAIMVTTKAWFPSVDGKYGQAVREMLTPVDFAPAICVLFLATRLRAIQITKGDTEKYGFPQAWVQDSMQIATWSAISQALLNGILCLFAVKGDASEGTALKIAKNCLLLGVYGGVVSVVAGGAMMEPPSDIWGEGKGPKMSPAMLSTIILVSLFMVVEAMHEVCIRFFPGKPITTGLGFAKRSVELAPMLCLLFVGARMRAQQIGIDPQPWAQNCFYICAGVLATTAVVRTCTLLLLPNSELVTSPGSATAELRMVGAGKDSAIVKTFRFFETLLQLSLYGAFTAVAVSVFTIEHPDGADKTPAVSPAMQCVLNLTLQFFLVYLAQFTVDQLAGFGLTNETVRSTVDMAITTVRFCPMLCVLFLGARMRALQLTSNEGAPQGFAQEAMFLATYALLIQLVMVLVVGVAVRLVGSDAKVVTDEHGNVKIDAGASGKTSSAVKWIGVAGEIIRYINMLFMYGGASVVCYAIFQMTPENCNGEGSLIPGVKIPAPEGPKIPDVPSIPIPGTF